MFIYSFFLNEDKHSFYSEKYEFGERVVLIDYECVKSVDFTGCFKIYK